MVDQFHNLQHLSEGVSFGLPHDPKLNMHRGLERKVLKIFIGASMCSERYLMAETQTPGEAHTETLWRVRRGGQN